MEWLLILCFYVSVSIFLPYLFECGILLIEHILSLTVILFWQLFCYYLNVIMIVYVYTFILMTSFMFQNLVTAIIRAFLIVFSLPYDCQLLTWSHVGFFFWFIIILYTSRIIKLVKRCNEINVWKTFTPQTLLGHFKYNVLCEIFSKYLNFHSFQNHFLLLQY